MKKDAKVFIHHILESIGKIERYVKDVDEKRFFEETQIQDAVIRMLDTNFQKIYGLVNKLMLRRLPL